MIEDHQLTTLQCFRTRREDMMEESVRSAVASLLAEGETPSFYKVAERAQIARSSLYRKQNLRQMVEDAREGRGIGGYSARKYEELLRENEGLRREVRELRRRIEAMGEIEVLAMGQPQSFAVEYCIIDFPQAA